jgi:MerR family transcriptional regulator, mercuric resistance operon regulatory protein
MNTTSRLTIGALSDRTEVNIETIRYYERVGILPKPRSSAGGQLVYAGEHQQRLIFIRRSRELGFSLDQIRALLGLVGGHRLTCAKVKDITEHHLADTRNKVRDLKRLERVLSDMASNAEAIKCRNAPSWTR